eukprot:SAG11_NODE_1134_length_5734_cov_4.917480_3_plen_59_part_00
MLRRLVRLEGFEAAVSVMARDPKFDGELQLHDSMLHAIEAGNHKAMLSVARIIMILSR